jgi:LmbE family N-acetylglucosaminyl deacetylase
MFDHETILVLAPHTDDGELGAGASISRWIKEGRRVVYAAFSSCQDAIPGGWPKDILESEVKAATLKLGIPPSDLHILDFQVRRFSERRQDVLDAMIGLRNSIRPSLVLLPARSDMHQDHSVVHQEGVRAFKQFSILGYELPWNNIDFTSSFFSVLHEREVREKIEALREYKSQANRKYFAEEFQFAQMRFRGTQIGEEFAEVFELVRAVSRPAS